MYRCFYCCGWCWCYCGIIIIIIVIPTLPIIRSVLLPPLIALNADANRRLDLDEFRVAIPLLNVSDAAAAEDDADDDADDDDDDDDADDDDDDDDDDDTTAANAAAAADQRTSPVAPRRGH